MVYLLIKNAEDWKEHRNTLWLSFGVMLLIFIAGFVPWVKSNQRMKKIRKQIEDYKQQIKNLENSIR